MILVVGATGNLGGMITSQLLGNRENVRVLVRKDSSCKVFQDAGAEAVLGDLKDKLSLESACQGVDTVITTATAAQRGGMDTFQTVDIEGNKNLVRAAKANGVGHLIFISALGASKEHPNPLFSAKAQAEDCIKASGMDYTILASEPFMEVWIGLVVGMPLSQGQPVTLMGEGRRVHSFISSGDVAAFAVASVNNQKARNAYIPLGGPQAVTWGDILASVSKVTGKDVPVNFVTMGTPIAGLPPEVTGLLMAMENYDSPVDISAIAADFGIKQTTVEEYATKAFLR